MRKAKLKIGELVEVPSYCFDQRRYGWNGWIFKHGVIRDVFIGAKTGRQVVVVETYRGSYGQELKNIRGEVVGYSNRETILQKFYADAVFAVDKKSIACRQEYVNEDRREAICGHTYPSDTEFDIDMGFIVDPHEDEKRGEVVRPVAQTKEA